MRIRDIISETSSAGGTGAGSIAGLAMPLGDPNEMHRSIYSANKSAAKKKKSKIIRRINKESKGK